MQIIVNEIYETASKILYLHKARVEIVEGFDNEKKHKVILKSDYIDNLQVFPRNILKIRFNCGCVLYLTRRDNLKGVLCRKHMKELAINKQMEEASRTFANIQK